MPPVNQASKKRMWRSAFRALAAAVAAAIPWSQIPVLRFAVLRRALWAVLRRLPLAGLPLAAWRFAQARRWLVGALVLTAGLLALILTERPTKRVAVYLPDEPDIVFDAVKRIDVGPRATAARFRPPLGREAGEAERASHAQGLSLGSPESDSDAEPPEPMGLGRRLDAFRHRQSRGAWLMGTIEEIGDGQPRTVAREDARAGHAAHGMSTSTSAPSAAHDPGTARDPAGEADPSSANAPQTASQPGRGTSTQ